MKSCIPIIVYILSWMIVPPTCSSTNVDPNKDAQQPIRDQEEGAACCVLVTGASGYLAAHCVQQLLAQGYSVRGTVRSINNRVKVQPLYELSAGLPGKLELVEADLEQADSWSSAVKGCTYVLHVASPFPTVADESIVDIAVQGTLNVLRACAHCDSVEKVVVTSSCAAINEGHDNENRVFTEEDWTNVESKKVLPYSRSKTEAERAAWTFWQDLKEEDNHFKLTCLNPTFTIGPSLVDTQSASISVMRRFMNHKMPMVPALQLACVDVRDVAQAHIRAMRNPNTDGERILITAQPSLWFREIAKILAKEFCSQGYQLPKYQMPYICVWLYSFIDPEAKQILARLNRQVLFDNAKARRLLGMEFKNPEESIIEMAYSLIERGLLPKTPAYKGPK